MLEAQVRFVNSAEKLSTLLTQKFSKDSEIRAASISKSLHDYADQLRRAPMVLNGNRACLASQLIPYTGLDLQRQEGRWKVIHMTIKLREAAAAQKFYSDSADAYDELCASIESRTFKNDKETARTFGAHVQELLTMWVFGDPRPAPVASTAPAPATLSVTDAQALVSLRGKSFSDPTIQRLFSSMPGTPRLFVARDTFFICSYETGIGLTFVRPAPKLTAINLYGDGDFEYSRYTGELPFRLAFGEFRINVERELGKPAHISSALRSRIEISSMPPFSVIRWGLWKRSAPPTGIRIDCRAGSFGHASGNTARSGRSETGNSTGRKRRPVPTPHLPNA